MEKLKRQLAEAEAALEARKKPPEVTGPRIVGEGLVIDEWVNFLSDIWVIMNTASFNALSDDVFLVLCSQKERRERYLARQQVEGVIDSV